VRDQHSHGEGLADAALPHVVVFPHSNEEVAAWPPRPSDEAMTDCRMAPA